MPFDISNIRAHQAFLCSCAAPRSWTRKCRGDLHGWLTGTRENPSRDIAPISWRVFGEREGSPTNQVNDKECWVRDNFYLSTLNLKDPFATDTLLRPRPVRNDESIGRCIPCSIPDSIRGQANHMFRNGYNIRRRSRTLCSYLRRKSIYWYVIDLQSTWCQLLTIFFFVLVLCIPSIACY